MNHKNYTDMSSDELKLIVDALRAEKDEISRKEYFLTRLEEELGIKGRRVCDRSHDLLHDTIFNPCCKWPCTTKC